MTAVSAVTVYVRKFRQFFLSESEIELIRFLWADGLNELSLEYWVESTANDNLIMCLTLIALK